MKCNKCGTEFNGALCPNCGTKHNTKGASAKLALGIISIVLSAVCLVGTLGGSSGQGNETGMIFALLLLSAGIVNVAGRKSTSAGITAASLYLIAATTGFSNYDLIAGALVSFAFGIVCTVLAITCDYKKNFYKQWWFYLLAVLFIACIFTMFFGGEPIEKGNEHIAAIPQNSTSPVMTLEPKQSESINETDDAGTLEKSKFKVKYISHSVHQNYENKPVLMVVFEFTNKSSEAESFGWTVSTKAYQDGVQLDSGEISYFEDKRPEECNNLFTEVKQDVSIKVAEVFELRNTESPVEVDISEFFDFDDTKLSLTLDIG